MPVRIPGTPLALTPQEPKRKLDCDHLELVEGELIDRRGKKRPHTNCLHLLLIWLSEVFGAEYVATWSAHRCCGGNRRFQPRL